ncbi:aminoglycoside phosphotransferase family protein [Nonomuraea sp. NPDC050643]|uniref:aminoglycoside phosphotransferase family protein n=1 Tax=Nonomuraea sp. NPDC050643 TaxID=3155660 RepID=UPI0033DCB8BF
MEDVTSAVTRAYALGEALGPLVYAARGELGRIWRLDTTGGSWAVKELLVPVEERDARADTAYQVAAAAAGVRLPRPRLTTDGAVLSGRFRVYEWVELVLGEEVTGAELGTVTAGLHRVPHPAGGPATPWFAEPVGRECWEALAAAGGEWAPALGRLLPELAALDALVVPPEPGSLVTCHRDLNLENVLRAADDGGVVVLDWENCGPGRPSQELAKTLAGLPGDGAAGAYEAYLAADGPARITEPADFSMAIAEQGHLLEFYARRALSPEEPAENRSRARARLATMLARPLTRARIDALLAAFGAR